MKKLNLFIIFLIVLCSLGRAQNSAFYKYTGTSATSSSAVYLIGTSTAYHKITWNVSGTVSTCTVAVDSSSDGVTWTSGGVISGQTCTSNGSSSVINTVVNYIRITFTTFTGTGSVIVSYTGYPNLPGGGVTSFNTRTGAVSLTTSDVNAIGTISNSTTGNAATATALASTVSNIQGDLICAEAGDTSIDTNTVSSVTVSGSGPYTSVITLSSSLSTRYQIIGNNIGVTGASGGFAITSAAITAFSTANKTITVSTATNPGTWSSGGTTFLACQNSANATSNTPFLNNYTIPANYWSTTANLLVSFPLVLWGSSSPATFQLALYDGGTVILNQGGTVTPYASHAAYPWQITVELYGMSTSLVDAHTVGYMAYSNAQLYAYTIDNSTGQPVSVTGSSSETLQLEAVFGAATAGNAVWMPRMTTTILSY